MTNPIYKTGYSSIPKNYDDYQRKLDGTSAFGQRWDDPKLGEPLKLGAGGTSATDFPVLEEHTNTARYGEGGTGVPTTGARGPKVGASTSVSPATSGIYTPDWIKNTIGSLGNFEGNFEGMELRDNLGSLIAVKHDEGKTDWSLMPFEALEEINKVLDFGAKKYNEKVPGRKGWNWTKGAGLGKSRVLSAIFRHLFAHARGEKLDPESGLSHIAHAGCGIIFILFYNLHPDKYTKE